jgi:hypothetical protein
LVAVVESAAENLAVCCFEKGEGGAGKNVCNFGGSVFGMIELEANGLEYLKCLTITSYS